MRIPSKFVMLESDCIVFNVARGGVWNPCDSEVGLPINTPEIIGRKCNNIFTNTVSLTVTFIIRTHRHKWNTKKMSIPPKFVMLESGSVEFNVCTLGGRNP